MTSSASTSSTPTTSASAVLTALLSSLAAYLLGAVVLPAFAGYVRRDRALKRLGLPTPEARTLAEKLFGTMTQFDPAEPANYCRAVLQRWASECGNPPLLVSRGLERHLVIVLDPGAATAVRGSLFFSLLPSFFLFSFLSRFAVPVAPCGRKKELGRVLGRERRLVRGERERRKGFFFFGFFFFAPTFSLSHASLSPSLAWLAPLY